MHSGCPETTCLYSPVVNVEAYCEVLNAIDTEPYLEDLYVSHTTGRSGYKAVYQIGRQWCWYSVSNITRRVPPTEVAYAIRKGTVTREGQFKRDGFEATVTVDGHWYMLGMGSSRPRKKVSGDILTT